MDRNDTEPDPDTLQTIENMAVKARELLDTLDDGSTAETESDAVYAISEAKRLARSILANGT